MTPVYIAAVIVGGLAVVSALVITDVGHGDGLPFLSLTGLSAALLGGGTGGLVATWAGFGGPGAGATALVSAVALLFGVHGLLLPYMRRQQANSHRGRGSYIGLLGTVTLEVPPDGWGEVAFVDADGNRVRSRAKTAEPDVLIKSTRVYIADVDAEYVHVVAVPEP